MNKYLELDFRGNAYGYVVVSNHSEREQTSVVLDANFTSNHFDTWAEVVVKMKYLLKVQCLVFLVVRSA